MDRSYIPNEIEPRLYLGGFNEFVNQHHWLRNKGITHILSVGYIPTEKNYKNLQLPSSPQILTIQVTDTIDANLFPHFSTTYQFIEDALSDPNNIIYVHCHMGVSRSATIIIAYLMKKHCMSYEIAFQRVKEKRSCIDPNLGFILQLKQYEDHLKTHEQVVTNWKP